MVKTKKQVLEDLKTVETLLGIIEGKMQGVVMKEDIKEYYCINDRLGLIFETLNECKDLAQRVLEKDN